MSIVGQIVSGTAATCADCGYGTVPGTFGAPFLVHAANCPRVDRDTTAYVACKDRSCRRVLDPARVRSHGAQHCPGEKCRARAWKAEREYGPRVSARNGQRRATSGLQVSYHKAVESVALIISDLQGWDPYGDRARSYADRALREALSVRQRAKLDRREQTNEGSST